MRHLAFLSLALLSLGAAAMSKKAKEPTANVEAVRVRTDDIKIEDPKLQEALIAAVKKSGTLTASSPGRDSYMVAVVCKYPHHEQAAVMPNCTMRKVEPVIEKGRIE